MFKLYRKYQKLKEIRLKYERLQCNISKILKAKDNYDLHKAEQDIYRDRVLEYGDRKKLQIMCYMKRDNLRKNNEKWKIT